MSDQKQEMSFAPTGDPFVDAGAMALEVAIDKLSNNSILDCIEKVATIYVKSWNANLFAIFHGSRITHKAYVGDQKISATVDLYRPMLENQNAADQGNCRICGNYGALYSIGRDQYCLSGSKPFANFHHMHEDGIMLCSSCSIKLFFLPLTVVQMGSLLALLHSSTEKSKKYWIEKTVSENFSRVGKGIASGILKHKYSNPRNALFAITREIIEQVTNNDFSDHLYLYHFTNFAAKPDCTLYELPSPVFTFLTKLSKSNLKIEWNQFIQRHYHISKCIWDSKTAQWLDKDNQKINDDAYLNNQNDVYEFLLSAISILPFLRRYAKSCFLNSKTFESLIAMYYATEVLRMEQKQIDLIRQIADVILDIGKKSDSLKKYLFMIESAGKAYQLRGALLKIVKDNFNLGAEKPVITLDDYVTYLFPDGQYWGEVRDMLLIYLYEKMHQGNIAQDIISDNEIEITEPETTHTI